MQQQNPNTEHETGPDGSIFLPKINETMRTDRASLQMQLLLGRGVARDMNEQERLEAGEALGLIKPRRDLGEFALRVAE